MFWKSDEHALQESASSPWTRHTLASMTVHVVNFRWMSLLACSLHSIMHSLPWPPVLSIFGRCPCYFAQLTPSIPPVLSIFDGCPCYFAHFTRACTRFHYRPFFQFSIDVLATLLTLLDHAFASMTTRSFNFRWMPLLLCSICSSMSSPPWLLAC